MRVGDARVGPQWWATPLGVMFCSPVGWVLLPVMLPVLLFLLVILAGLGVTLLPALLGVIGAFVLRRAPLAPVPKRLLISLVLLLGIGLNGLAWHAALAALHAGAASPSFP